MPRILKWRPTKKTDKGRKVIGKPTKLAPKKSKIKRIKKGTLT